MRSIFEIRAPEKRQLFGKEEEQRNIGALVFQAKANGLKFALTTRGIVLREVQNISGLTDNNVVCCV